MEEKSTFGKFVNQKRKEAGLTQKEMAKQIYVTESAVSKWERGISYPDITLVTAICGALHITEHELITASEDHQTREIEKQAKKFRIINKTYSRMWYFLYGISLLACFICNLAVDHKLSWFFVVLAAEAVAFTLTSVPVIVKKDKRFWTAVSFYAALNVLLAVCRIEFGGGWFATTEVSLLFAFSILCLPAIIRRLPLTEEVQEQKALLYFSINTVLLFVLVTVAVIAGGGKSRLIGDVYPIVLFEVLWAWILMIVIRYACIHPFFKTSVCLVVSGIYTFIQNSVLAMFLDHKPFEFMKVNFGSWTQETCNGNISMIILMVCIIFAALFTAGGISLSVKKERQSEE